MRIIGGKFRGRQFQPGRAFRSRPTTDFSRESLFNILENRINWEETCALDLFAGTGSISFELVSRGCSHVTAVEYDPYHCRFIAETAEKLGIRNLTIIRDNVFRFLTRPREPYNLVFADPPYTMKNFHSVAVKVLDSGILREDGLFILEHSKANSFDTLPGFLELRKYGSVYFSFLKNKL